MPATVRSRADHAEPKWKKSDQYIFNEGSEENLPVFDSYNFIFLHVFNGSDGGFHTDPRKVSELLTGKRDPVSPGRSSDSS